MAIKRARYRPKGSGNYGDIVHFETDSKMVKHGTSETAEDILDDYKTHKAEDATNAHKPENVGVFIATQAEAEAGASNTKYMTPLRTKQAIDGQGIVGFHNLPSGDFQVFNSTNPVTVDDSMPDVYTKLKETTVYFGGTFKISFSGSKPYGSGSNNPTYRIYRNGTAVGTIRTATQEGNQVFTEEVSGWVPGDKVQVYGKRNGAASASARDLKVSIGAGMYYQNNDPSY